MTRFCWKKPKVCLEGVAVRPMSVGVEVFEHLPPEIVDGAVAFIGDDEVEFLDREGGIVFDRDAVA